jgi:hypothetical protein
MSAPIWLDLDDLDWLEEEELAQAEEEIEEILRYLEEQEVDLTDN